MSQSFGQKIDLATSAKEKLKDEQWLEEKNRMFDKEDGTVSLEEKAVFIYNSRSLVIMPLNHSLLCHRSYLDFRDFYDPNIGCTIPLILDRLIARWLKLKKRFRDCLEILEILHTKFNPVRHYSEYYSAFVLLQSTRSWTSLRLIIDEKNLPRSDRSNPYSLMISIKRITPIPRSTPSFSYEYPFKADSTFTFEYPFAWFWLILDSADSFLNPFDIECQPACWRLESTYDPSIYLLMLYPALESEDDCARVLKEYFLRPKRFDVFKLYDHDLVSGHVVIKSNQPLRICSLYNIKLLSSFAEAQTNFQDSLHSYSGNILNQLFDQMIRNTH